MALIQVIQPNGDIGNPRRFNSMGFSLDDLTSQLTQTAADTVTSIAESAADSLVQAITPNSPAPISAPIVATPSAVNLTPAPVVMQAAARAPETKKEPGLMDKIKNWFMGTPDPKDPKKRGFPVGAAVTGGILVVIVLYMTMGKKKKRG